MRLSRARRIWLAWRGVPGIVRAGVYLAAVIVLVTCAGCAAVPVPSVSGDVVPADPAICQLQHVRVCIAQWWVYFKFPIW